tara:strand:- start:753 stop:1052 length:300 start_codon:yes stop_codon:yes gene_type:complete
MKKILISIGLLFLMSSSTTKGDIIYCRPEVKACIHNLVTLKAWLKHDYENNKISSYLYEEYLLVINNTTLSLEMILDNKGQCDTTNQQPVKFAYKINKP